MKPFLIMLSGPPCSGKSTWINFFKNDTKDYELRQINILSSDDIIEQYAQMVGKTYTDVFKEVIPESTRILNFKKEMIIRHNTNFIWDQTNLGDLRSKLEQFKNYLKIGLLFQQDWDTLIKRNEMRNIKEGKFIPLNILRSMYEKSLGQDMTGFDLVIKMPQNGDYQNENFDILEFILKNGN